MFDFTTKQKKGYVSIEVVIVAGIIVGVGAMMLSAFGDTSAIPVGKAVDVFSDKFKGLL